MKTTKEEIIFETGFTEEEIQTFSEANYGRELTETEIHRIRDYLWDDEGVFDARIELMAKAIEAVMNSEDNVTIDPSRSRAHLA